MKKTGNMVIPWATIYGGYIQGGLDSIHYQARGAIFEFGLQFFLVDNVALNLKYSTASLKADSTLTNGNIDIYRLKINDLSIGLNFYF